MINVLVIEPDPLLRRGILQALQSDIFAAAGSGDGYTGLGIALRDMPEVVLMDIDLPRLSGLEVLREIRRGWWRPAVIFITAHKDFQTIEEAIALGATGYILKPVDFAELMARLHAILAQCGHDD